MNIQKHFSHEEYQEFYEIISENKIGEHWNLGLKIYEQVCKELSLSKEIIDEHRKVFVNYIVDSQIGQLKSMNNFDECICLIEILYNVFSQKIKGELGV
jgi:hypothetical protein